MKPETSCLACESAPATAAVCAHLESVPLVTCVVEEGVARCTACHALEPSDEGRSELALCGPCYAEVLGRSLPVTPRDLNRGYALAPRGLSRAHLSESTLEPTCVALRPGAYAKLTFSAIPAPEPPHLESMWVRVDEAEGELLSGPLVSEPTLFEESCLANGSPVEFEPEEVVLSRYLNEEHVLPEGHSCADCDQDLRAEHQDLDEGDLRLLADVRRVGWHLLLVPGDEEGPGFGFTVGLHHSFEHPELILFGLELDLVGDVLNELGGRIARGGIFDTEEPPPQVLAGHECVFRDVALEHYDEYLGYGNWFYRRPFPAIQLVWSDAQGRFPGNPEFPAELAQRQPVLAS